MTINEIIEQLEGDRADANKKALAAYEQVKKAAEVGAAEDASPEERSLASADAIGGAAQLWVQGIRMAALSVVAPGEIAAAIVSDARRDGGDGEGGDVDGADAAAPENQ